MKQVGLGVVDYGYFQYVRDYSRKISAERACVDSRWNGDRDSLGPVFSMAPRSERGTSRAKSPCLNARSSDYALNRIQKWQSRPVSLVAQSAPTPCRS
jgi:hypothetical protein